MQNKKYKFNSDIIKTSKYKKFQDFHNLMRFRVRDIILVSSLYDSYIFEEDNRLYELIRKEFQHLNLSHSPELIQVSSGAEAIELTEQEERFDLILTTQHIEDMHTIDFAKKVRKGGIDIPIVLLGYNNREMLDLIKHPESDIFDKIFIWQGDYRIILGIIKYLEDKYNVEYDTQSIGVQVIILVEDSIRFYSSYLPHVYTQVLNQSQSLLSEGINLSHKFLRMRARPKILLVSTYEEAMHYYEKYEEYILGIISDVDFLRDGEKDSEAGIKLAKEVKSKDPDLPILLQSKTPENERKAYEIGCSFVLKDSPTLLHEVQHFMMENFSFGDFVFRIEEGKEVGRAKNLKELQKALQTVPDESIYYHSEKNHFSNWLKARTEFWLAQQFRPRKVSDYPSISDLRKYLINSVRNFRSSRQRGVILDFNRESFEKRMSFARIGGGSIGGKARGLGFINNLLSNFDIEKQFPGVNIFVPPSVTVATDYFDSFLTENNLEEFALNCKDDKELIKRFLHSQNFPSELVSQLRDYLCIVKDPLAVRSSSLLEDSQGQPFAGVYETYMLPNSHTDVEVRLIQLLNTIKLVYASTFFQKTKDYIQVTSYRLEEEKMAVIIQKLVGNRHENRFYPEFSGVAKSYNFYPAPPLKSSDGIVQCAFGLGKTIVEGGSTVRFCPKYPKHLLQYATIEDILNYSQQEFFALDLEESNDNLLITDDIFVRKYYLSSAEDDNTLPLVGSTYSSENNVIYDGTSRSGSRLFTLAPILKYRIFPLPEILELLMEMGAWGMGSPVEIEFAANLSTEKGKNKEFGILQMRPLVINDEKEELNIEVHEESDIICKSENVLGNGRIQNIYDIIFVDINHFDRSRTREVAREIGELNSRLINQNKRYILIGVGRWGTLDPWLGIPVTWEQISGANAIVESNFKDFNVAPSQGSHFFQNLTSFKVGYFTVNNHLEQGFIDWSWLEEQSNVEMRDYTRHVTFNKPITIKINGQKNIGVILKPGIE
ncbi:MAG: PEP/pyruvate-binding domain-containing protein [Ignavibacteria bacterium]|jgi:CheY-like chemotaxis protein